MHEILDGQLLHSDISSSKLVVHLPFLMLFIYGVL